MDEIVFHLHRFSSILNGVLEDVGWNGYFFREILTECMRAASQTTLSAAELCLELRIEPVLWAQKFGNFAQAKLGTRPPFFGSNEPAVNFQTGGHSASFEMAPFSLKLHLSPFLSSACLPGAAITRHIPAFLIMWLPLFEKGGRIRHTESTSLAQ